MTENSAVDEEVKRAAITILQSTSTRDREMGTLGLHKERIPGLGIPAAVWEKLEAIGVVKPSSERGGGETSVYFDLTNTEKTAGITLDQALEQKRTR